MLAIPQMIIHLTLERGLHHPPGQPGQQPALADQSQALGPGVIGQLRQQLLIHRIQRRNHSAIHANKIIHVSHRCSLHLRSYTDKFTVPPSPGVRL